MPHCDCGFDFSKAFLEEEPLVAYALVPHENYRAVIRREYDLLNEGGAETKLRKVANASSMVGNLVQCPCCGSWLLAEPEQRFASAVGEKPWRILTE